MPSNKDHIDNIFGENHVLSQETMQKYLDGDLSPQEMHAVEKIMVDDDFYDDVLEGMELIKDSHVSKNHIQEINNKIPEILEDKNGKRVFLPLISGIAASIALVIGLVYLFNSNETGTIPDTDSAYKAPIESAPSEKTIPGSNTIEDKKEYDSSEGADLEKSNKDSNPIVFRNQLSQDDDSPSKSIAPENYIQSEDDEYTLIKSEDQEQPLPTILEESNSEGDFAFSVEEAEEEMMDFEKISLKDKSGLGYMSDDITTGTASETNNKASVSNQMLAIADPAVIPISNNGGVTAISNSERKADKSRKEKVAAPSYREDSYQAKSVNKKEHHNKKKESSEIASRSSIDLGADADMKFNAGQYEKAASLYELTLQQHPTDVHSLYMAGVAYIKSNESKKAISYLSKVTTDKNIGGDAQWYLAIAYADQGNITKAKETLNKIINGNGSHALNAKEALKKL